jgi:hypothetical protein
MIAASEAPSSNASFFRKSNFSSSIWMVMFSPFHG